MAPVRKRPGGTTTRPPPAPWQAAIAAAIAAVASTLPLGSASKSVIGKSAAGKLGRAMPATIAATWSHGSVSARARRQAAVGPSVATSAAEPARKPRRARPAHSPRALAGGSLGFSRVRGDTTPRTRFSSRMVPPAGRRPRATLAGEAGLAWHVSSPATLKYDLRPYPRPQHP